MELDALYRSMSRARTLEDAIALLWAEGRISGEMHLGTGEESVAAGVVAHLREGDAVALDHRATPFLMLLGVDPVLVLKELLGREDGLCRGRAGHMHLMSPGHHAAASGIVGAAAPLGAGFALAAKRLRPGSVAVGVFGDGAANAGMVLETLNLAVAWELPLLLVCKDNGWAITTRTADVTGGELGARAASFGLATEEADGADVVDVSRAAARAVERARRRGAPTFLHVRCGRFDGHFLGDPLVSAARHPSAGKDTLRATLAGAFGRGGAGVRERVAGLGEMIGLLRRARRDVRGARSDPLERARRALGAKRAEAIDVDALAEVQAAVAAALGEPA